WRDGCPAPAEVPMAERGPAVRRTAAAALLARHWPGLGARHEARLALAGGLLRNGVVADDAAALLVAVCTAAGNTDLGDCRSVVESTAKKLAGGENVVGLPRLAKLIGGHGAAVTRPTSEWLGPGRPPATTRSRPPPPQRS